MTKSEFNTNKKAYRNVVVDKMKSDYKDFEISDNKLIELYNEITYSKLKITDEDTNLYFTFLYACKKNIEQYLMKECSNNNLLYQIMLAEKKEKVVSRYLSLKKLNKQKKDLDSISFEIIEDLIKDYDSEETLDNQYIKKLKKRFNK